MNVLEMETRSREVCGVGAVRENDKRCRINRTARLATIGLCK